MQEIQPAGNKLGRNQADAVRRIARLMKFNYVIWCVVGGFTGSKLLYFLTNIKDVLEISWVGIRLTPFGA